MKLITKIFIEMTWGGADSEYIPVKVVGVAMSEDFRQKVKSFAERMVLVAPRCTNEESTKMFLVLPFLHFLGYDDRNPEEVWPEHSADYSDKYKNRVDFAIMLAGTPVIAIECKAYGIALKDERGQLRSYFHACQSVKMGVLTDGIVWEFYADSDEPNIMDQTAFLSLDMRELAKGKMEDSAQEGLLSLQKAKFDPINIGAEAKRKLIFASLVHQIDKLAAEPSEAFVRMLLNGNGLSHVRARALTEYVDLTKAAFGEFINQRILNRLDLPAKDSAERAVPPPEAVANDVVLKVDDGIVTTEGELAVFQYTKRRLAFLIKEAAMFDEIEKIDYRDYKGKFVVYYKKERAGRLFDFYEGSAAGKKFRFDFGADAGGEVSTDTLADIDAMLEAVFRRRTSEMDFSSKRSPKVAA